MHNCDEFRERITEFIIDRQDLAKTAEFQHELMICSGCSEFYAESREMIEALSSVDLSISESQWSGIESRLRLRIVDEPVAEKWGRSPKGHRGQTPRPATQGTRSLTPMPLRATTPFLLAAAALMLVTIGLSRFSMPVNGLHSPPNVSSQELYVEHSITLDPVTVDFLEESELLLRNVMKIAPNDAEDLADAKKSATQQLAGIKLRKEAAADVPPVVEVMDTYETVLRDLRNVDERNAAEDIPDIQKRIQKNALIANIKAFQPGFTPVSYGLR